MTVDWGDGNTSIVTSYDDADIDHTYSAAGDYTLTITGTAQAWYFHNTGDKDKIISVTNLGAMGWTDLQSAFKGCSKMTSFAGGDTSAVTNMSDMFSTATGLTSLDLSSFDTSAVTNMISMFYGASGLTSLDLSGFNITLVSNSWLIFGSVSDIVICNDQDTVNDGTGSASTGTMFGQTCH